MKPVLAYSPRPGPLGRARPLVAALYLMPLAAISFSFSSPAVLLAVGLAAVGAAAASGAGSNPRLPCLPKHVPAGRSRSAIPPCGGHGRASRVPRSVPGPDVAESMNTQRTAPANVGRKVWMIGLA